jgi:hypothetical protein
MCGAIFMTSCNSGDEGAVDLDDKVEEKETLEIETVHELNENGKVEVLVFNTDVPAGTKISAKMLDTVEMDPDNLPRNVVSDAKKVRGKYSKKDFYKGDYIIENRLQDSKPLELNDETIKQEITKADSDFLVVTDYVKANTGEDLYDSLQMLINKNPGRTIYFPDGEYVISHSLETRSNPKDSTSFYFSSGALLKASDNWKNDGTLRALICLGSVEEKPVNNIRTPGSNFYVMGGIFDGNGKADGISIDGGRETLIKDVVIVNTRYGIHIKEGTNNSSSDSDIDDVTIIGNGLANSIGITMVGLDNTVSNARISNVKTGVQISGGVFVNNCLVENPKGIENSVGFTSSGNDSWYSNCVSVDCDIAFYIGGARGFFKQCTGIWTKDSGRNSVMFDCGGSALRSALIGCKAEFYDGTGANVYLRAGSGGKGRIVSPIFDSSICASDDRAAEYIETNTNMISPAPAKKED